MNCLTTAFWDDANVRNLVLLKHRLLEAGDIRWHWMSRDKYMVGAGTRFNFQPSGIKFVICDDEVQLIHSSEYSQTKYLHLIMQLTCIRCWVSVNTHPSGFNIFPVLTWHSARKKVKKYNSNIATSLNYGLDASFSSWSKFICNPEMSITKTRGPLKPSNFNININSNFTAL